MDLLRPYVSRNLCGCADGSGFGGTHKLRRRLSNKEIADVLNISESTVKYHISNLFGKLQVTSRHELVRADAMPGQLAQVF